MAKGRKSSKGAGRSNRSALPFLLLVVVLAVGAGYWYGTHQQQPPSEAPRTQVRIPRPVPGNNDVVLKTDTVPIDPKKDPIRQAVEAQLSTADGKSASAFPRGTKLVDLSVKDGTAIVDLSPEFKKINNGGDTMESLAYNALRQTLAQFESVKRMRVLVGGKVFEGEHSGSWAEVNVRDDHARVEDRP